MDFFGSFPRPEPPQRQPRRVVEEWERPEEVVPAGVTLGFVLVHTETTAAFLGNVRVYPAGFEFTVHTLRRRSAEPPPSRGRGDRNPFGHMRPFEQDTDEEENFLRLGVLFADGRRAMSDNSFPRVRRPHGEQLEPPFIQQQGGHGGGERWEQNFWVWGLPEQGPVTVVYSWLAESVPEGRFDLDGDVLREAATRAVVLWPDDAEPSSGSGE